MYSPKQFSHISKKIDDILKNRHKIKPHVRKRNDDKGVFECFSPETNLGGYSTLVSGYSKAVTLGGDPR